MKNARLIAARFARRPAGQRGVTLYVVMIFVLLSVLLVLWASRTAMFSEMVVGNDVDYQRAFEAAQALVQDAELDIRGETSVGTACTPAGSVCRQNTTMIPLEAQDVPALMATLENVANGTRCLDGLCAKRIGRQDFWNYTGAVPAPTPEADSTLGEASLASLTAAGVGARYGQYTGAGVGSAATPINPILTNIAANQGGWYWIEVLPYNESSQNSRLMVTTPGAPDVEILPLIMKPNVVYRITALAHGRKPSTMVVLQETYVRQKQKD